MKRLLAIILLSVLTLTASYAQSERKSVRHGNRDFKKENYQEAEINYKKALVADSTSAGAGYNLANTYYRMDNYTEADRYYGSVVDSLAKGKHGSDVYHNMGNSLVKQEKYQEAIEAYKNSLRLNPEDMKAKENLAYAQKMLKDQQQNQDQNNDQNQNQNQDQNQDQNNDQNNDQNQDQNNDQNQDQNQDQNNDQNQDQNQNQNNDQNQDQNQNQNNDQNNNQNNNQNQNDNQNQNNPDQNDQQQNQPQNQPGITPQAAQQMLQAIQAQEKDTQEKVKKEKALMMKSKQKEKNW